MNFFTNLNKKKTKMRVNGSIKSWAEDDRPREKMILKGRKTLSDAELLAILLGTGTRDLSAVELAQVLLKSVNNDLASFSKYSINELKKFKGIGEAKAVGIVAALELGRRRKETETKAKVKITSSKQVYEHMRSYLSDLQHEEFFVIYVNRANEIVQTKQISIGGLSGTIADGKVIFKQALELCAHGLILVHNHPSGQLKPSDPDRQLTKKMVEFGKYIDLCVLDHLIYTDSGYFSFADEGIL
jgi:DNA repair protein RadC